MILYAYIFYYMSQNNNNDEINSDECITTHFPPNFGTRRLAFHKYCWKSNGNSNLIVLLISIMDIIMCVPRIEDLCARLTWMAGASNYANPVYGVSIICHQVRCLRWGHPSLFHTATSLFIWYKMFRMRDISYRHIWMKCINMLSVYAQSGTHSRFNWWIIAVLT